MTHGAAHPRTGTRPPRRALWIWLAGIAIAIAVAARSHYVADLSAFLPSAPTAEQGVLLDQLRNGIAARLVLIGIEGGTASARADASRALAQAMRTSGRFESVHNGDDAEWADAGRFLFEHRYLLSPAVDAERFTTPGLRAAIDDTLALLGTPAGALVKPVLLHDPTGETARLAEALLPSHAPRKEDGVWVSRTAPRAVLLATTKAPGADLDAQEQAFAFLHQRFAPLAAAGLRLELSGAGVFGVASRAQIKAEVERLAIAGSVVVTTLLLVAFGSGRALLLALLPVATGVLAGIAAVSLGFGQVHGVTLGFGTTLIGEAVDYAIYYLIQAARARPARAASGAPNAGWREWLAGSWPTVRLGLLTSLCGFAALAFSGFPGLAQLGVFSMAGLSAAALSTRYVFPILAADGAPGHGLRAQLGATTGWLAQQLPRVRVPLALVALAASVALVVLPSPWRADLSSLSPIGAERLARDAELRADLATPDAGTLVAVSAAREADVLRAAEFAASRLDPLIEKGVIDGYDTPTWLLPSRATQAARRAALPDATTLATRLAAATAGGPLPATRLGPFIADVQAARQQPDVDRKALDGTPLGAAVDALLVPGSAGQPWRAFISLQPGPKGIDLERVRRALADLPGARVVAIKPELDALYARYLREATLQALLGALAVCGLLALRLRSVRRLLRVAEPIAAAVVLVLAGLTLSGAALGILHLVGLLLVVAIGSNYALFFDHLRERGAPDHDTLASLALANLTTVASFGLLAFSGIPALYPIGQVVAPGALLSLLLSAAFIGVRAQSMPHGKMPPS